MKTCSKTGCSLFAAYTASLEGGRTPLNTCGRHLTWAVQFIGSSGVRVYVDIL